MLMPIDTTMLPHVITIFNYLTHDASKVIAIPVKQVSFKDSNAYHFSQTGTTSTNAFSVIIDYKNSSAGGRKYIDPMQWALLRREEQEQEYFTLYADMWLIKGTSAEIAGVMDKKSMTQPFFSSHGLKLLTVSSVDVNGLTPIHHFRLGGV